MDDLETRGAWVVERISNKEFMGTFLTKEQALVFIEDRNKKKDNKFKARKITWEREFKSESTD